MDAKFYVLSVLVALVSACDCAHQSHFIADDNNRQQLIRWADENVFSRTFNESDFRMGSLVGPGKYFSTLAIERIGISPAKGFETYEVHLLGKSKYHPDMIFIGRKSYVGILISRGDFPSAIVNTDIKEEWLSPIKSERVAALCYEER